VDFANFFSANNTIKMRYQTTTSAVSNIGTNSANVYGNKLFFNDPLEWNYPTNLAPGLSAADGDWYFYLTEKGTVYMSNLYPFDRLNDLYGWYHPFESWLCVGGVSIGRNEAGNLPAVTGTFDPWTMISFGSMTHDRQAGALTQDLYMYDITHVQIRDGFLPCRADLNLYASRTLLFSVWQYQRTAIGDASAIPDAEQFNLPTLNGVFMRE
jgi:hypothetical protein